MRASHTMKFPSKANAPVLWHELPVKLGVIYSR